MTSASRTTYLLERAALGELSDAERDALADALGGPDALSARLDALAAENAALLEAHPPSAMAHAIEGKLRTAQAQQELDAPKRRRARFAFAFGAAALAAILLFVLWPRTEEPAHTPLADDTDVTHGQLAQNDTLHEPDGDTIRLKGRAGIRVFRKIPGGSERLEPGALTHARDVLQVQYTLNAGRHGVIFSIDGRGAVTLHHPARASESTLLKPGTHVLDFSYTLDDAPDFERFFFITSADPIAVQPILDDARKLAHDPALARTRTLDLDATLDQHSTLVTKP